MTSVIEWVGFRLESHFAWQIVIHTQLKVSFPLPSDLVISFIISAFYRIFRSELHLFLRSPLSFFIVEFPGWKKKKTRQFFLRFRTFWTVERPLFIYLFIYFEVAVQSITGCKSNLLIHANCAVFKDIYI